MTRADGLPELRVHLIARAVKARLALMALGERLQGQFSVVPERSLRVRRSRE